MVKLFKYAVILGCLALLLSLITAPPKAEANINWGRVWSRYPETFFCPAEAYEIWCISGSLVECCPAPSYWCLPSFNK